MRAMNEEEKNGNSRKSHHYSPGQEREDTTPTKTRPRVNE